MFPPERPPDLQDFKACVYVSRGPAIPSHADNRCLVQTAGRQSGHKTGRCKGPWGSSKYRGITAQGQRKIPHIYLK